MVLPSARTSRERMTAVLDALSYGLWPSGKCPLCREALADRCPECCQLLEDAATVNAAIDAVGRAGTDAEALTAYKECLTGLANAIGGSR
jgi:hypothetical protein